MTDIRNDLPAYGAPAESGWYYDPVSEGHGVLVHNRGDDTAVYWYTGNDDPAGYPRYYYGYGKSGEEIELLTTAGGTVADPTLAVETKAGRCRFTGGIFAFELDGHRSGIKMVSLLPATESDGVYFYEQRKGEGISVHEFTDLAGARKCSVGFWTYGPKKLGTSDTTQRWYVFDGEWNGEGYDLTAYETRGRFQRYQHIGNTSQCGTGTLIPGDDVLFSFLIGNRNESYVMGKLL